ncbi:MAG TPA: glycosyltransferase [Pseudonocardiaceae bacterium]|jgi:glycosyltransferase involved in cell wall biosynthesis
MSAAAMRTVLVDAGPWLPVPPGGYGGLENVVATLVGGLRQRGVRVVLASVAESTVECDELVWRFDRAQFAELTKPYVYGLGVAHAHESEVVRYLTAHPEVDLVHSHLEVVGPAVLAACGDAVPPTLHTLHWDPRRQLAFYETFDGHGRVFFNAVSAAHLARAPLNLRRQAVGSVLLATPPVGPQPPAPADAPFVVLGRISPLKGQDVAARCAHRIGADLVLAGPVAFANSPRELADAQQALAGNADAAYWAQQVKPLVDGRRVRWPGVVRGAAKQRLLAGARALLMPVQWDEPGATAVVEAFAAGTPVIGLRRGALPELVEHGVTGYLADDEDEFAYYMAEVGRLDRQACLRAAQTRFSPARMVEDYLRLYELVLDRAGAPALAAADPAALRG